MPLYDYRCQSCGHTFELKQDFNDDPVATCPRCQGQARRLFRPVGIIFKGSGWYVNDHGRKVQASSNGEEERKSPEPSEKPVDSSKEPSKQESGTSSTTSQE